LYVLSGLILSLGLLAAPPAADAQQPGKMPRIGLIRPGSPPDPHVEAFLQGLRDLGYVEGRTIAIEHRWAEAKPERIPAFTEELVRLKVDVIVTGTVGGQTAKRVTSTIPVVIPTMPDPVGEGLVASLARPGGNITGLSLVSPELSMKRLELLKETLPKVSRVAVLRDPRISPTGLQATEAAARALGLHLQILDVWSLEDLETAFATAKKARAGALDILVSSFFFVNRVRVVEAVGKARVPAMYEHRAFVDAGGLISYGPNFPDLFRRAATYVDKILKGTKPADLPVEQPMRFELVLNMKTAKALGITFPQTILIRADQVIQ
jgi:putative ABC transport system substrate-binding protein